ncbi:MAG: hypothetical protein ABSA72_10135 [Nitrososphaerales archaeon]
MAIPTAEEILNAFHNLGTQTSVATFFGVSRRTLRRWTKSLELHPEIRPEIPIGQVLSGLLSDPSIRARIAQWIVDEASITVAHSRRYGTTSLLVVGAMNDYRAMEVIAGALGATIMSGPSPKKARLPTHVIKIQGVRAYSLLGLLSRELTGLKALEAKAALSYFTPSGIVKGKLTTEVFMGEVWREFATQSAETWNKKRRMKLTSQQIEEMIQAWIQNRIDRARRGLERRKPLNTQDVFTSAMP